VVTTKDEAVAQCPPTGGRIENLNKTGIFTYCRIGNNGSHLFELNVSTRFYPFKNGSLISSGTSDFVY
jgi:hypothetical protein